MSRRGFVRTAAAAAAAVAGSALPALSGCFDLSGPGHLIRSPLLQPSSLGVTDAVLSAHPGSAAIAEGESAAAWLFNGSLPGPTLRARRGDTLRLQLVNGLPDPTVVHWHGLLVPEAADGHPSNAIAAGSKRHYDFPVVQRAGTYWYHPHAHHLTAEQIHRGLAGFFIVTDGEEDSLQLPSGDREILILLQDRDTSVTSALDYVPGTGDRHEGMLRGSVFGNGIRLPSLDVGAGCYRFRVANASHARIYRIALDSGAPFTVIGNDGGLLPTPVSASNIWLGVGERTDFLLDFTELQPYDGVMLWSLGFEVPGTQGKFPQGMAMEMLQLNRVERPGAGMPSLPPVLSSILPLGGAARSRTFEFRSAPGAEGHRINGSTFDMQRVDVAVPFGEVERWIFRNDSALPHPVHMHGTQFQIVSRAGGRGAVLPYEAGWKDTALLLPEETVEALVRFDAYRGLFLLHCHNLQHEDMGMMLNVDVV